MRLFQLFVFITLSIVSPTLIAAEFVDIKDGTIKDKNTGLFWQKGEQDKLRWEKAKQFCSKLRLAGKQDWRLPSKQELMTLVERNMFNPSIDRKFFPQAQADNYWSSSLGTVSVGSAAWMINFGYGEARYLNKYNESLVRCVRSNR